MLMVRLHGLDLTRLVCNYQVLLRIMPIFLKILIVFSANKSATAFSKSAGFLDRQ